MNAKPTPGPWRMDFGPRQYSLKGADCHNVVFMALPSEDYGAGIAEIDANAEFILAAVNACFQINPENPIAVAEALPELVESLKRVLPENQSESIYRCTIRVPAEVITRVRATFAKVEAKP